MDDKKLEEKVLDVSQRMKRGQVMRRNKAKLQRNKEILEKKPADAAHIKKRAYAMARQIVRKRFAGKHGADYENLSTSEKISVDRTIEKKQAMIKKLALRLIPKVKSADMKKFGKSFMKGSPLPPADSNVGKPVKESVLLNALFHEEFKSKKTKEPKGDSPNIKILQRLDGKVQGAISKKSEKSGVCEETLARVYIRGLKSWSESSGVSPEQYAFARVNSFINQGKTYFNEDSDLVTELSRNTVGSYYNEVIEESRPVSDALRRAQENAKNLKKGIKPDSAPRPTTLNQYFKKLDIFHKEKFKEHKTAYEHHKSQLKDLGHMKQDLKSGNLGVSKHDRDGQRGAEEEIHSIENHHRFKMDHHLNKMHYHNDFLDKPYQIKESFEEVIEESLEDFMRKHDAVMSKFGGQYLHTTKQHKGPAVSGYVVGHDPKKSNHVLLSVHSSHGVRSKNNDDYETHSVHEKHLTTDYKKSAKVSEEVDLSEGHSAEQIDEISSETKSSYRIKAKMDKVSAQGALKHYENQPSDKFNDREIERNKNTIRKRESGLKKLGEQIEVGHHVHIGFGSKGGAGFRGKVVKVEGDSVHVKHPSGKVYKGPKNFVTTERDFDHQRNMEVKNKIIEGIGNSQNDSKKREEGTDSAVKAFKKDTPGEIQKEGLNEGKMKELAYDLDTMDHGNFKKKYGKSKLDMQGYKGPRFKLKPYTDRHQGFQEEVKTADREPIVIPTYKDDYGNTIPAKTVMRKKDKKIINSGNVHDGDRGNG